MKPCIGCVQIVLLLFASSFLNGQPAEAKTKQTDQAEIARLEDRWLKAIAASDFATLDSILADDFVRPAPTAGQFITKSQLLDYLKSHKPTATTSRHIENLTVAFYGTTAIARGNVVTVGATGEVVSKSLFTDVFVIRGNHWQAVSAQENDTNSP